MSKRMVQAYNEHKKLWLVLTLVATVGFGLFNWLQSVLSARGLDLFYSVGGFTVFTTIGCVYVFRKKKKQNDQT